MKIFLDDYRSVPEGWFGVKTVDELEDVFLENKKDVTHISLDNNLGKPSLMILFPTNGMSTIYIYIHLTSLR